MARDPERSTWWELEHSWWLVLIALSLSFRTWAAFGYIWMRTRVRSWLVAAVGYLVLLLVAFYFLSFDDDSWQVGFGAVALLGCWVDGFVHGLAKRRETLDLLSLDEDPRLRAAARHASPRRGRANRTRRSNARARSQHRPGGLVDVNSTSADELAQLPGFTVEVGRRIVEVWEKIDDFDNVDDFARMLDLPPRLVDRIAIG